MSEGIAPSLDPRIAAHLLKSLIDWAVCNIQALLWVGLSIRAVTFIPNSNSDVSSHSTSIAHLTFVPSTTLRLLYDRRSLVLFSPPEPARDPPDGAFRARTEPFLERRPLCEYNPTQKPMTARGRSRR